MMFQRAVIAVSFMAGPGTSHLQLVVQKCTYVVILVAQVWKQPFDNAYLKLMDNFIGTLCLTSLLAVAYFQEELMWVTREPNGKLVRSRGQIDDPARDSLIIQGEVPNTALCWGVVLMGSVFWYRV